MIQQPATDVPASALMSIPITAQVLALRPGSPNPLKVVAGGDKLPTGLKQKKPPGPPDASRVLTELASDTKGWKPEPLVTDSNPADDRPQPMVVALLPIFTRSSHWSHSTVHHYDQLTLKAWRCGMQMLSQSLTLMACIISSQAFYNPATPMH